MEIKKYLPNHKSYLNEDFINHYIFVKDGQIELYKKEELIKVYEKYQNIDFDDLDKNALN